MIALSESGVIVIIELSKASSRLDCLQSGVLPGRHWNGQVAQVVERSPEKAGVGGSTPSLATIFINHLADQPKISHL